MGRRAAILAIMAVGVALGALREFLLINLNYQIDHLRHGRAVSYAHSAFQAWTKGLDLRGLVVLKWGISALLVGAMLLLAVLLARTLWGDHRYRTRIIFGFVLAAALALAAYGLAAWWPPAGIAGVKVLHALQYPVVLFLLWAASGIRRA